MRWQAVSRLRAAELRCLYCCAVFAEREVRFRCSGRPGRDGQRCDARPDDVRGRWLNDTPLLSPVFAADGRQSSAACPDCGERTYEHVCPHCHRRLPAGFGRADHRPVVIVGPTQSGKTVLETVLIHELSHQLGGAVGVAVRGLDDETLHAFHAEYDHPLFDQHTLPKPSDPLAGCPSRAPLVFELAPTRPSWLHRRQRRLIVSFLDISGSDLASPPGQDHAARHLADARAIILVLDPLQMPGARGRVDPEMIGPKDNLPAEDHPTALLNQVTELLLASPDSRDAMIRKPVAVVIAKLDTMQHTLPTGSALATRPAMRTRFDIWDGDTVSDQVERLIDGWAGPQFGLNLRAYFTRYRYFGVSALGSPPRDAATIRVVVPYRIHDLALWLLCEFGAVRMTENAPGRRHPRG